LCNWIRCRRRKPDPGLPASLSLAAGLLRAGMPYTLGESAFDHLTSPGAALPARMSPVLN